MARSPSSIVCFRHIPRARQNPNTHIRNLILESTEIAELATNNNQGLPQNLHNQFSDVARQVSRILRTRSRWEATLASAFPSFNFSDPKFFRVFLQHENNVLLSIRFFHWLSSQSHFVPDNESCATLFVALVEANACNSAKLFLDQTGYVPENGSLEGYIRCLCEGGLVEEAVNVFDEIRGRGFCPSIETWNFALLCCLKVRRTDLFWMIYQQIVESEVGSNIDLDTAECLIRAFCDDGKNSEGYELLHQLLSDGLVPTNAAFNKLISVCSKERNYSSVSELLHAMIARNKNPDVYTYQEVINGLCKSRKRLEAFRIFNDLKDRGYNPDVVMYTTMIHGFCKMGWLGDARKLWFEMLEKGMLPNKYTYNALMHGFCRKGDFDEARKLYMEMCDRGYKESTLSCNTMIAGLCLHGKVDEARELFEEMSKKGIAHDVITYNSLIKGFCKKGKIIESISLLKELMKKGLQPSTFSYTPLIQKLCQAGDVQEAKNLWYDMQNRGLEPMVCTRDHMISGLCEEGFLEEAVDWLVEMLKSKLKPQQKTFETLIYNLSQRDNLNDCLLILDLMLRIGYVLREGICNFLVTKLCKENSSFVEMHLEEILQGI